MGDIGQNSFGRGQDLSEFIQECVEWVKITSRIDKRTIIRINLGHWDWSEFFQE